MRAEDYVHSKYSFGCETRRVWELEKIVELMEGYAKEYALQVAAEAVEEEIEHYDKGTREFMDVKYHGHYILENIKKRLDADSYLQIKIRN